MNVIRASNLDEQSRVSSLDLDTLEGERGITPNINQRTPASAAELEIERLRKSLAASELKRDELIAAAREDGRLTALAAYHRDEAAHSAMLASSIREARDSFAVKIEELNASAVMICENALARLLGNPARYGELIEVAIKHHLEVLQQDMVINLRVSAEDFPQQESLAAIANAAKTSPASVEHDPSLKSGSCRVELRLGTIDISLPEYWNALQRSFSRLKLLAEQRT